MKHLAAFAVVAYFSGGRGAPVAVVEWLHTYLRRETTRGPGIESRCGQKFRVFHENHCDTQLWARAAH